LFRLPSFDQRREHNARDSGALVVLNHHITPLVSSLGKESYPAKLSPRKGDVARLLEASRSELEAVIGPID